MGFYNPIDNLMYNMVPFVVFTVFAIVVMVFMTSLVKGLGLFFRNNSKPQVSMPARIVGKRAHVWGSSGSLAAHTSYYATFEFENGERIEMPVKEQFLGVHTEGDTGMLTHQGTRFCSFERERS